ncbi:MAG: NAD(P)H-dependent oxidoreductase [Erythrobacter sp.]
MNLLLLDGHPDANRLTSHLLDIYAAALPEDATVTRIALRDLAFSPNLRHGYARRTEWEPDLHRLAAAIDSCDHLAIAFPMWWGSEPAELKGLLDRVLLPGFAFAYRPGGLLWDRLLEGRSADVIATMDTPPLYLRFGYGNAIVKRWKRQVLGFCGFDPVRFLACGPVKNGAAEKALPRWHRKLGRMARSIRASKPEAKQPRLEVFLDRPRSQARDASQTSNS